jgi:hypothetical protein
VPDVIDARLDRLATFPFRRRFHLRGRERALVELRGLEEIRRHARELIDKRVAPEFPAKDGKQTPWRGHPVFVAQHATATCCRSCLAKNHDIAPGQELSEEQRVYVVDVIARWIERDYGEAPPR